MVFKHFANKQELYSAILDYKACDRQFQTRFEDLIKKTEAKDDYGVFYTMALNALDHHSADGDFIRLMLHSALEEHDLARMFFEGFITEKYKFLGDYIEQRQADGGSERWIRDAPDFVDGAGDEERLAVPSEAKKAGIFKKRGQDERPSGGSAIDGVPTRRADIDEKLTPFRCPSSADSVVSRDRRHLPGILAVVVGQPYLLSPGPA